MIQPMTMIIILLLCLRCNRLSSTYCYFRKTVSRDEEKNPQIDIPTKAAVRRPREQPPTAGTGVGCPRGRKAAHRRELRTTIGHQKDQQLFENQGRESEHIRSQTQKIRKYTCHVDVIRFTRLLLMLFF